MKALKLAISPAALCFWALCLCVGYSITSSNASRVVAFKQESRFGYAKTSFPLHMKRWDETLFALLAARAKSEMAEFLKNAEQEAAESAGQERGGDGAVGGCLAGGEGLGHFAPPMSW